MVETRFKQNNNKTHTLNLIGILKSKIDAINFFERPTFNVNLENSVLFVGIRVRQVFLYFFVSNVLFTHLSSLLLPPT